MSVPDLTAQAGASRGSVERELAVLHGLMVEVSAQLAAAPDGSTWARPHDELPAEARTLEGLQRVASRCRVAIGHTANLVAGLEDLVKAGRSGEAAECASTQGARTKRQELRGGQRRAALSRSVRMCVEDNRALCREARAVGARAIRSVAARRAPADDADCGFDTHPVHTGPPGSTSAIQRPALVDVDDMALLLRQVRPGLPQVPGGCARPPPTKPTVDGLAVGSPKSLSPTLESRGGSAAEIWYADYLDEAIITLDRSGPLEECRLDSPRQPSGAESPPRLSGASDAWCGSNTLDVVACASGNSTAISANVKAVEVGKRYAPSTLWAAP